MMKRILEVMRIEVLLVRVTAPVITIAATSKTRNKKKSHLFFCITWHIFMLVTEG